MKTLKPALLALHNTEHHYTRSKISLVPQTLPIPFHKNLYPPIAPQYHTACLLNVESGRLGTVPCLSRWLYRSSIFNVFCAAHRCWRKMIMYQKDPDPHQPVRVLYQCYRPVQWHLYIKGRHKAWTLWFQTTEFL